MAEGLIHNISLCMVCYTVAVVLKMQQINWARAWIANVASAVAVLVGIRGIQGPALSGRVIDTSKLVSATI